MRCTKPCAAKFCAGNLRLTESSFTSAVSAALVKALLLIDLLPREEAPCKLRKMTPSDSFILGRGLMGLSKMSIDIPRSESLVHVHAIDAQVIATPSGMTSTLTNMWQILWLRRWLLQKSLKIAARARTTSQWTLYKAMGVVVDCVSYQPGDYVTEATSAEV